jgi:hypothetical protein
MSDVLACLQELENLGCGGLVLSQLLHLQRLSTTSRLLLQILERLLDEFDILNPQLLADDSQVTDGVNVTLDVNDLSIVETSNDLENGVDSTNMGQEGVTKTSTSGGTAGQTGNIIDGQIGRNLGLGLVVLTQPVKSLIRNDDLGLLRVNGSIRKVGGVTKARFGDSLEQCGLADVCETNLS